MEKDCWKTRSRVEQLYSPHPFCRMGVSGIEAEMYYTKVSWHECCCRSINCISSATQQNPTSITFMQLWFVYFLFLFFLNPAQVIRGKLLDIHSCIWSTFIDLCRSVSSRHQVTLNDIYYNYYLHDSQIKRKVKWMIKVTLLALFYSLFHFFFVGIFSLPYFKRSL